MKNQILNSQKGVSLYISFMIMTILLTITFGISAILFGQMKMIRGIGDSVIALYAADTGVERELFEGHLPPYSDSGYLDLNGNGYQDEADASYNISVIATSTDGCPAEVNYCIKSIGIYKETRRAIRVQR